MRRSWLRLAPALLVGMLLAFAAVSATRRAAVAGADGLLPPCTALQSGGSHLDSFACVGGSGLVQPLGLSANIAACSLDVHNTYYYSQGQFDIQCWNPATLAPDPTTIALRSLALGPSDLIQTGALNFSFSPPVVGRRVSNLAEPPAPDLSVAYRCTDGYSPQIWYLDPNGAAGTPAARVVSNDPAAVTPLNRPHGVSSHLFCGGASTDQDHYVVQSVMTTSVKTFVFPYEFAQRFRVPVVVSAQWVELAFPPTDWGLGTAQVEIYDSNILGAGSPPSPLPAPLLQTTFEYYNYWNSSWSPTVPFDHAVQLVPGHDYYLLVRSFGKYTFYARTLNGSESPTFQASIGTLHMRPSSADAWYEQSNQALDFRLIGSPVGVLGAPATEPALPRALRLRVTPNPAAGAAFVAWSGARGSVRFDVLDARGRRVASGSAGGGEGRWRFAGLREDGRPLAAGVYFIRATDGEGRAALDRVVLIR